MQLEMLDKKYPLVPHTYAGQLSSSVRRMRAEREMNIPIHLRSDAWISAETGNRTSDMTGTEWESFYQGLRAELKRRYPVLHDRMFAGDVE